MDTEGNFSVSDWSYRKDHTPEWRAAVVDHEIDPGLVHHRKIETILGSQGMSIIDEQIRNLPHNLPDWQRPVRIGHIYTRAMLMFCKALNIRSLRQIMAKREGHLFCSNEELGPARPLREGRVANEILLGDGSAESVELQYSTEHVFGSTLRERLHDGGFTFSIIAELQKFSDNLIIFDPVIIGSPWLEATDREHQGIEWYGSEYYQQFVEDFDEFGKVTSVPEPASPDPMRLISEAAVKACFAEILGDRAGKDWGGETSDYYSTHLRIGGRRVTAAFLFKGPARFGPMDLAHLGKKNDQIVRLAEEPADVLIIQHCHDILPVVQKTLRAFAVQPSNPRRYCCIDGRDTLRLLKAYNLYEKAVVLSSKKRD
jgi:hypothetical protein